MIQIKEQTKKARPLLFSSVKKKKKQARKRKALKQREIWQELLVIMVVESQWKPDNHFIPLDDSTFLCSQSQTVTTQKSYRIVTVEHEWVTC